MTEVTEPTEPDCACGKSIDEVSLAHYLSCGPDAPMDAEEAADLQERVVAGLDRAIGPYDITWAQWAWIAGGMVLLSGLALAVLAWRDRRRK